MNSAFLFLCLALGLVLVQSKPLANDPDVEKAMAEEIKEFHFHVYFFQDNPASNKSAEQLRDQITKLVEKGFFHPVPGHVYHEPMGPHIIGQYEVWCPKEHFSRTYSWMLLHRGIHSVLIHPLTRLWLLDHTDRIAFMGNPVPLDPTIFIEEPELDHIPLQYPELGLGYSAKA